METASADLVVIFNCEVHQVLRCSFFLRQQQRSSHPEVDANDAVAYVSVRSEEIAVERRRDDPPICLGNVHDGNKRHKQQNAG